MHYILARTDSAHTSGVQYHDIYKGLKRINSHGTGATRMGKRFLNAWYGRRAASVFYRITVLIRWTQYQTR